MAHSDSRTLSRGSVRSLDGEDEEHDNGETYVNRTIKLRFVLIITQVGIGEARETSRRRQSTNFTHKVNSSPLLFLGSERETLRTLLVQVQLFNWLDKLWRTLFWRELNKDKNKKNTLVVPFCSDSSVLR